MRYRLFGPTGLRVSELFLGAMTFGEQGGVGGDVGGKGIEYPIGAGSAWVPG